MKKEIVNGVYPTMLTPYNTDQTIDYEALKRLIEWYIDRGIDGLFAVCQSSDMFELSRDERVELCRNTVKIADGRYPVMASGHVSDTIEGQINDMQAIAETGADALVLVSNRLAAPWEDDKVWLNNLNKLMKGLPEDLPLGFYECPYPYKRILSAEVVKELIAMGRFEFIKDTCCDPEMIKERAALSKGTKLKFFNANAATLLMSLKEGFSGYSGIMTNFHSDLYYKLCHDWEKMGQEAEELQNYLGCSSTIENQFYPANARYNLIKEGVMTNLVSRRQDARLRQMTESQKLEIEQFYAVSQQMSLKYRGA
ncbi:MULTISPECIES: dihydrodipicolinate synthase family protein [unclassified Oceanispirochaeta]|uniref:dihydrodipicolinate synthase family protein n=1 Tax=unclassified Oceanispirochaeta TaxID=2635722 RepID=UPI000E09572B|nr:MULTISPECIES: dihydrodipicolinate synthase family protein [unclassified Oceanispirochaeta]MBF9017993.1 dihydrodipicolinate synthase family protein [Oceanispirochaeta sp. M2]NPD74505.1 dihydrodipicolinate synthase family protein [Oceanispirochaeta sp. M1]RDG29618.1 dihydrodipicolinate synthase family protein [Oceanispirochaeta sp. M1]